MKKFLDLPGHAESTYFLIMLNLLNLFVMLPLVRRFMLSFQEFTKLWLYLNMFFKHTIGYGDSWLCISSA